MKEHVIVALVATSGVEDFLENSLLGLARAGIDPRIVHVARPDNAAATVDPLILKARTIRHSFAEFSAGRPRTMPDQYVDYGTAPFVAINWEKVRYIHWLLGQYRHVVYADLDVGWLADPLWYLDAIGKVFPLAFQTEAVRRFPPVLCWGFVSAKSSRTTLQLLERMLRDYDKRPPNAAPVDEQQTLTEMIARDPMMLQSIHLLSEGLFVNGIGYRSLLDQPKPATSLQGRLEPFVFHANWTVGLESKRDLMRQTGTWLLDAK